MPCPISDRRRVPPPIRQQLVDEFTRRPGHAVLLSQVEASGVGTDIQAASTQLDGQAVG